MLPTPTTTAISTPRACTRRTCSARAAMRSGSAPYSSGPISASPDSLRRIRLKAGAGSPPASSRATSGPRRGWGPLLAAHLEAGEAADDHVLAGLRSGGRAQVLDRLALVLVLVHVLLVQQHVLLEPLAPAAL